MEQGEAEKKTGMGVAVAVVVLAVLVLVGWMWFATGKKVLNENLGGGVVAPTGEAGGKAGEVRKYNLAEVARHAKAEDCWMAIDGKVYDVTAFVSKHPGGESIVRGCGMDASKLFNERPTNSKGPHPESARGLLKDYYIGDLALD